MSGIRRLIEDPLFPEVDCLLRTGWHAGAEDIEHYTFIQKNDALLNGFYKNYGCSLVREHVSGVEYYFLDAHGTLLRKTTLPKPTMRTGMFLAYLGRTLDGFLQPVAFDALVAAMREKMGEDAFTVTFVRSQQSNAKDAASQRITECLRELCSMNFAHWPHLSDPILPKSPVLRFLGPIWDNEHFEHNFRTMVKSGLFISDEFLDDGDDPEGTDLEEG